MLAGIIEKKSKKILSKEVRKLGGTVEEIEALDVGTSPSFAKVLLVASVGGTSKVSRIQISRLAFPSAPAVFLRPFAGAIMHPGEIHAIVRGSLPGPVALTHARGWSGPAERLSGSTELAALLKKFSWELRTNLVWSLPWALQVRPLGDGTSQLAFGSGTYMGLFSVGYGVTLFRQVLELLPALLGNGTDPAAAFTEPGYGDLALPHLGAQRSAAAAG